MDKDSDKRIDINSDENADWIKNIPGSDANAREIEIYKELAKRNGDTNGDSGPRPPAPQA